MAKTIKNFIGSIQTAEEPVKRFWIGVFSAGAMVVVLALWGFYGALISAPREVAVTEPAPPTVTEKLGSLTETKKKEGRIALLGTALKRGYAGISDALKQSYNIKVQEREEDFIYDDLRPVPPTLLP